MAYPSKNNKENRRGKDNEPLGPIAFWWLEEAWGQYEEICFKDKLLILFQSWDNQNKEM